MVSQKNHVVEDFAVPLVGIDARWALWILVWVTKKDICRVDAGSDSGFEMGAHLGNRSVVNVRWLSSFGSTIGGDGDALVDCVGDGLNQCLGFVFRERWWERDLLD